MPRQPREDTHRGSLRKLRGAILIDHAHILHIESPLLVVCSLNHASGEVEVRDERFIMVKVKLVPPLYVDRQTARLDEDRLDPILLRAQEAFRSAQIIVDVRCGSQEDGAKPPGRVAAELVVDGAGGEEDDLRHRLLHIGVPLVVGILEFLQRSNQASGRVQADIASGYVVVGGDDVENRPRVADALDQ